MERTFVMIKPDGVQRCFIGKVIAKFEEKGLKIIGLKMLHISRQLAEKHYAEHVGKDFYDGLIRYITSGAVVAMVLEGKDSVQVARNLMGSTNPVKAEPGTIRGDYGLEVSRNIVHGSDSIESASREISLFFNESEFINYTRIDEMWLYE